MKPRIWAAFVVFAVVAWMEFASAATNETWNPQIVEELKAEPIEKIFGKYQPGREIASRTQSAYMHEILQRPGALDFVSGQLQKTNHANVAAREKAVYLLPRFGRAAKPAVPLLIAAFDDNDNEIVQHRLGQALAELGPLAIEAKPVLLEELRFQNPAAPRALMKIDPASDEIFNALIEAASDISATRNFRNDVVNALVEYRSGKFAARAADFLGSVAADKTNPVHEQAEQLLPWFKPSVQKTIQKVEGGAK